MRRQHTVVAALGREQEAIEQARELEKTARNYCCPGASCGGLIWRATAERAWKHSIKRWGLIPADPEALFCAACLLAKLNDTERALELLSLAVDKGYRCHYASRAIPGWIRCAPSPVHGTREPRQGTGPPSPNRLPRQRRGPVIRSGFVRVRQDPSRIGPCVWKHRRGGRRDGGASGKLRRRGRLAAARRTPVTGPDSLNTNGSQAPPRIALRVDFGRVPTRTVPADLEHARAAPNLQAVAEASEIGFEGGEREPDARRNGQRELPGRSASSNWADFGTHRRHHSEGRSQC